MNAPAVLPSQARPGLATEDADETLAALVLLRRLHANGVTHFFCNPGTDFPAIVEAYSIAEAQSDESAPPVPRPIVVPHENAAMAMAHGAFLITDQPQAVMVHVSVGTANAINGVANACRDQAPLLLLAGRSPITEAGLHGSRNRVIHWAQEMYDQAGMLREFVKWDQELKLASETQAVVDRAIELMMTSPRGPAYLSLPRETLSGTVKTPDRERAPPARAGAPWPDPSALATLADWMTQARNPLIIASASGRRKSGFDALSAFAQNHAVPVVSTGSRYVCLPTSHDMHLGFAPKPLLQEADLVLVLDCDVPWLPALERPPMGCRIAHIAEDPAFAGYPTRGFAVDLSIRADAGVALTELDAALRHRNHHNAPAVAERRRRLAPRRADLVAGWRAAGDMAAKAAHITPEWASRCLSEAVGTDAIIVNEYPLRLEHCPRERFGSFFGLSPSGGLGWGLGAALGIKLSAPDRLVVATLGDGAYMFDNPTACHWVSAVQKLPILILVFNNQMYGAVRNSTISMYQHGASADNGCTLLADLSPSPAFEKIVEASGGYGERVDKPADLPAALARALDAVTREQRQALINVVCKY
jgi:acetolactate synthase I/II/III large subunit